MLFFSPSPDKRKKELASWARAYKIDALYNFTAFESVTSLDLSFKQLDKLPKQIDCLPNL
jgi:hypothetical protein